MFTKSKTANVDKCHDQVTATEMARKFLDSKLSAHGERTGQLISIESKKSVWRVEFEVVPSCIETIPS